MNKIVIVGHPASGYEEVLALLRKWGMSSALPSRREGLLPQDVTATLCRAHKVPPVEDVVVEEGFAQIEAAPVWQGMALDLMLGNLDQPLWGWADPQTIYALEYWQELDPQLTFVLVYDEPHRALTDAASRQGEDDAHSAQDLRRLLDNWVAYNGALLRFHLRHAGRSLLVHGQQVQRATERYAEQLQPLLDTPLTASGGVAALQGPQDGGLARALMPLSDGLELALSAAGVDPGQAAALLQADPAERYIVDDLLARHPDVTQLYAELQSVANLPLDAPPREAQGAAAEAWQALMRQRGFATGLMVRLQKERQAHGQLEGELVKLRELAKDNELLLAQLHRVQQELEQYYLRLRDTEVAKEGAERDRRRCRRRLEEAERAKASAEREADELRGLSHDNEFLRAELELARRDRRRCRRQLEEVRRGKAGVEQALEEASRHIAALESRVETAQSELRFRLEQPPDLSVVYSRTLLATLIRRLRRKFTPRFLRG